MLLPSKLEPANEDCASRVCLEDNEQESEAEEKRCRVCFGDEEDGPLVQPCACRFRLGHLLPASGDAQRTRHVDCLGLVALHTHDDA